MATKKPKPNEWVTVMVHLIPWAKQDGQLVYVRDKKWIYGGVISPGQMKKAPADALKCYDWRDVLPISFRNGSPGIDALMSGEEDPSRYVPILEEAQFVYSEGIDAAIVFRVTVQLDVDDADWAIDAGMLSPLDEEETHYTEAHGSIDAGEYFAITGELPGVRAKVSLEVVAVPTDASSLYDDVGHMHDKGWHVAGLAEKASADDLLKMKTDSITRYFEQAFTNANYTEKGMKRFLNMARHPDFDLPPSKDREDTPRVADVLAKHKA